MEAGLARLEEGESWCLNGGEDFELVLALAPPWAAALVNALEGSQVIGQLVTNPGGPGLVTWRDGACLPRGSGEFDHFQPGSRD
jgi:thiamine-monophosphate kinase